MAVAESKITHETLLPIGGSLRPSGLPLAAAAGLIWMEGRFTELTVSVDAMEDSVQRNALILEKIAADTVKRDELRGYMELLEARNDGKLHVPEFR